MQTAIFGYTGFVGGWILNNVISYLPSSKLHLYNSQNYTTARNNTFDTVYFAGLPAAKWIANSNPETDWKNITNIMEILRTVRVTQRFVLISTIDVYENHAYGKHRRLFEEFVQTQFAVYLILRLPALFGKGLKKNVLYDLLNNNQIDKIVSNSKFQWYDMQWLKTDIFRSHAAPTSVVDLTTEPIHTFDIVTSFFPEYSNQVDNVSTGAQYNYKSAVFRSSNIVKEAMGKFIADERKSRFRKFKLGVSCIGTKHDEWNRYVQILKWNKISYCELAPTLYEPDWDKITADSIIKRMADIPIYSFQSITFGIPYNMFLEPNLTLAHLYKVVDLAKKTNIKRLVFGCPKTRRVPDDMESDLALALAVKFFRELCNYCDDCELIICIENNSSKYNCNFLTTPHQVAQFVRTVNHSNIKMMLDCGNAIMEGLTQTDICNFLRKNFDILHHVHASEPNMKSFTDINNRSTHEAIANTLRELQYDGGVTMEILPTPDFAESVRLFSEWY